MSIADELFECNDPPELHIVMDSLRVEFDNPELRLAAAPTRLAGGFWAEMWQLVLDGNRAIGLPSKVVLRLAPDANLAARETAVQSSLASAGYPTPIVRASGSPTGASRAWCVMDFCEDRPLIANLNGLRAIAALPRLVRAMPDALATMAFQLHGIQAEPVAAALSSRGFDVASIEAVGDMLVRLYAAAVGFGNNDLQGVAGRLIADRPVPRGQVVCHGDLHPLNVLQHDGHFVVLDWTASQLAEPTFDLAYTHLLLSNPPMSVPRMLSPAIRLFAKTIGRRFVTTYQRLAGVKIDPERLDWFCQLHAMRILIELESWRSLGTEREHAEHPWHLMEPGLRRLVGLCPVDVDRIPVVSPDWL